MGNHTSSSTCRRIIAGWNVWSHVKAKGPPPPFGIDAEQKCAQKSLDHYTNHFIASVCGMVKKRGKKAIKWEGLANTATKDVIILAWEGNSTVATEMLARGYATITCPWSLGVPWEAPRASAGVRVFPWWTTTAAPLETEAGWLLDL